MEPNMKHVKRELERTMRRFNHDLELFKTDYLMMLPPVMMCCSIALLVNTVSPSLVGFFTTLCVSLTGLFFTLMFYEPLASAEWLYRAPSAAALVAALHGEELRDLDYITNSGSVLWLELEKSGPGDEKLILQAIALLSFYAAKKQCEHVHNVCICQRTDEDESTTESCSTVSYNK